MNSKLHLKLVTPVDTLFDKEVDQVIIDTVNGQITVLPDHSPLVVPIQPGEAIVKDGEEEFPLAIAGGILEMSDNTLSIAADSAERPSDIDLAETEKRAKQLAKDLESQEKMDINTYRQLEEQLRKEQAKLKVASKWRA